MNCDHDMEPCPKCESIRALELKLAPQLHNPEYYVHFDGMCWPRYGVDLEGLSYLARYGTEENVVRYRYVLASVIDAYLYLIGTNAKTRARLVRRLKK